MSILLLLIPLSVLFVVIGGIAFFWAANRRQFDNVDAAAFLPMIDGDPMPDPAASREPKAGADAGAGTGVGTGTGAGLAPPRARADAATPGQVR